MATDDIKMRSKEEVIIDIRNLVQTKGYIYALCMILFEDFHFALEKLHEVNQWARLNRNEASLLLGLMIQRKIDFSTPDSPEDLIQLKRKTYELMGELHNSFQIPFFEKLKVELQKEHSIENANADEKEFWGKGDMLTEPIFYSGTGAYDIQFLDFLERKYKYDKEWLSKNKNFDLEQARNIATRIKDILQKKAQRVRLHFLKEEFPKRIEELKKEYPHEDIEKQAKDFLPILEFHQYVELFFDNIPVEEDFDIEKIGVEGWKSFYQGIVELRVIRKSDFDDKSRVDAFLDNFSISPKENLNSQFQNIGNYNLVGSHPIIKLDQSRYFVSSTNLLFEAVYESPYYWMRKDETYRNQLSKNRGDVGEEIAFDFLSKVFGKHRTFKRVKIRSNETDRSTVRLKDDTDIDVLCVLGSKALSVQVKSKKLTEVSRTGDDEQLHKDFKGAVQDAFGQGLVSRKRILERDARFIDENGSEIKLSEKIDEVYIMVITSENYPSLAHQIHFMLEKTDEDPYPIVFTIFDLELLIYYLTDPYDFLYYIRQRISLMDFFRADDEMVFLGYHLDQKLRRIPNVDRAAIDPEFGQLIDRNYYPIRIGVAVSEEGDAIKNRWKNKDFDKLCDRLKSLDEPKITDIIFHLLDASGEARKKIVEVMVKMKLQTSKDGKNHDFSVSLDSNPSSRVGVTYVSLNSDNGQKLKERLLALCQARKYKSKGDVWIGFGSLKGSSEIIDAVVFNDQKWQYDEGLERLSRIMLERRGHGRYINHGKKTGRNDKCPCGSGLKYKRCCGRNE